MLTKATLLCAALMLLSTQVFAFGSKAETASSGESAGASTLDGHGPSVWITRPDGGQQCAPKSGQSLESSADELKNAHVRILNSQKGSDSKMRAQMCGIPNGKTNTFEIPKEDLPKAIALGFHQVK